MVLFWYVLPAVLIGGGCIWLGFGKNRKEAAEQGMLLPAAAGVLILALTAWLWARALVVPMSTVRIMPCVGTQTLRVTGAGADLMECGRIRFECGGGWKPVSMEMAAEWDGQEPADDDVLLLQVPVGQGRWLRLESDEQGGSARIMDDTTERIVTLPSA